MSDRLLQNTKWINALPPVADAYSNAATDVINMRDAKFCTFIVQEGVGTAGTATFTVEACNNTTPSLTEAVAFRYKILTSGDTEGDTTNATVAGFTTTAGSNHMYMLEVEDSDLTSDYQYVRMAISDTSASNNVLAGISALLTGVSDAGDDMRTAIV